MPLVSAVIPAFNAGRFLSAAIESVLAQTIPDIEAIVVDDGSTDDTAAVARRYGSRVSYLRQENAGVAAARNLGISVSRAELVAFLDSDDTWMPHKIQTQLGVLQAQPARRACHSAFLVANVGLKPIRLHRSSRRGSLLEDLLLVGNVVGSPTTVICARTLLQQVGGFDSGLSQCADWDMWIRLSMLTDFAYVGDPLATYRQHSTSMSSDIPLYEADALRVLDRAYQLPGLPQSVRDRKNVAYGRMYMVLAGSYWHARRLPDFARCARRAIASDPRQFAYLFPWRRLSRALRGTRAGD